MNNIKVLIFDLDNTLINYGGVTDKAWELACQRLTEKYEISVDYLILSKEILRINNSIWEDEERRPKGNVSFYELRKSIVKEAFDHLDIHNDEAVEFLVQNYSDCKYEAVYMFEDVPVTLKSLKDKGYIITLLTNGDSKTQRDKLKRFNMNSLFDSVFIDGEQGVGKPEKEAYKNILRKYQVQPFEACMIGDHYLWEVVAPKKYGLKAIWVNRGELGLKGNEDIKADYTIKDIAELLKIF